jgi:transposase
MLVFRAPAMYSLIETAKLNGVNPQAHLADVLARIADHPAERVAELLPGNWPPATATVPLPKRSPPPRRPRQVL